MQKEQKVGRDFGKQRWQPAEANVRRPGFEFRRRGSVDYPTGESVLSDRLPATCTAGNRADVRLPARGDSRDWYREHEHVDVPSNT